MPEPLLYLEAMGAAAIVSTCFVLAMAGRHRAVRTSWLNVTCIFGMVLGLACGYCILGWRWNWPPSNGLDRFLTIVLPIALSFELVSGFPCVPHWIAWLLRISMAATIPRILLHGSVYWNNDHGPWSVRQTSIIVAASSAMLAGSWWLLLLLSRRSGGVSIGIAQYMALLCTGLTVMMAGYLKGGVAAFPLAATIAATTLGVWLHSRGYGCKVGLHIPALLGMGVVSLFGLAFIGCFFGRLPTGSALALFLAPLLCWVAELPRLRCRSPWLVGSTRLVLVAIPLVVVLILAKRDFDRNMAPFLQHNPS